MKHTIEAKEQELKRIYSDDYLFEIPAYQRPYSWTTEQTAELLDDLMTAMQRDRDIETVPPYFLGSIVLIKDPLAPGAQVVDGQQRLTTITILFCVLREITTDAKMGASLDKFVREEGDQLQQTEDRYRLSLRDRDRLFFQGKIQEPGLLAGFLGEDRVSFTDSQQRLHENAGYLWRRLSQEDEATRARLSKFLVLRCYLVVVSASDQDSAYRIFSVMNDRGLDLSPTDILKADIIGALPDNSRSLYTDQWEEIEEELGRENFRDLFAHIRMIYLKSKARGSLNQEFRNGVLSQVSGSEFLDDVLVPLSEAYQIVSRAAYQSTADADKVNAPLRHLARLDNYDWTPPAIAYFKRNRHNQQALIAFSKDLERLAYGLFILRANINDRISRYAGVLNDIEAGADLHADGSTLQLTQEEKSSILAALEGPIYLQTRVRLPLLLRLNSLLTDAGVAYEHAVLSIEHVLPQTPAVDSVWMSWFPDEELRVGWTHRLANLVLLSRQKNAQAQNFDFERKKQEYFQQGGVATFALTTQVLGKAEWTPEVLEARQRDLIARLKAEWRLG